MSKGILIVADHAIAAEAIRRGLRTSPSFQVVGYVDGREPCAAIIAGTAPAVVLIDEMRSFDVALARIREIRAVLPVAKLVLITLTTDAVRLAEAVAAGVDAAISKTVASSMLGAFLREVVNGNIFHAFTPVPARAGASAPAGLTVRELEILRLVAAGTANAHIAEQLCVTEQTVKFHLSNVFKKLGVANRTQASHYAHMHGLIGSGLAKSTTGGLLDAA